jgi:hypothetical protein
MDLQNMAEFSFMNSLSQKNTKQFLERTNLRRMQDVHNLLKIYYFIHINGECWSNDIEATMTERRSWTRAIKIANNTMANKRLIRIIGREKIRGDKYELTNKGMYIIDQYISWMREEQRKVFYAIKLSRKKAKEHKENK